MFNMKDALALGVACFCLGIFIGYYFVKCKYWSL